MNAWNQARNVLCIRLDYLGDVLMTTPALRALREAVSGRRLTLLTSPGGEAVARHIPEIDDAIVYAPPWLKSSPVRDPDYLLGNGADAIGDFMFSLPALHVLRHAYPQAHIVLLGKRGTRNSWACLRSASTGSPICWSRARCASTC